MAKKSKRPKVYIFTGVSQLAGVAQYPYVAEVINGLRPAVFISGGAPGIDTMAAVEAKRSFPKKRHIVVKPFGYKLNQVHFAWCRQQKFEVIELQRQRGGDHPNIVRNQFMIDRGLELAGDLKTEAILVAFPGSRDEPLRSGTWSTIRRADKAGLKVRLYPLSEADGSMIGGMIDR